MVNEAKPIAQSDLKVIHEPRQNTHSHGHFTMIFVKGVQTDIMQGIILSEISKISLGDIFARGEKLAIVQKRILGKVVTLNANVYSGGAEVIAQLRKPIINRNSFPKMIAPRDHACLIIDCYFFQLRGQCAKCAIVDMSRKKGCCFSSRCL